MVTELVNTGLLSPDNSAIFIFEPVATDCVGFAAEAAVSTCVGSSSHITNTRHLLNRLTHIIL